MALELPPQALPVHEVQKVLDVGNSSLARFYGFGFTI